MRETSINQPDLEDLKTYGNKGKASQEDYTAGIISAIRGCLDESLHLFEHVEPRGEAQKSTRDKAFEVIDLTSKTYLADMEAAFGIKKYAPPTHIIEEGAIVCEAQ